MLDRAQGLRPGPELDVTMGYRIRPWHLELVQIDQTNDRFNLRLYRPTPKLLLAVFSDGTFNGGRSISNSIEQLTAAALNDYINSDEWSKVLFFQYHGPDWYGDALRQHELQCVVPAITRPQLSRVWTHRKSSTDLLPPGCVNRRTRWYRLLTATATAVTMGENLDLGEDNRRILAIAEWLMDKPINLMVMDTTTLLWRCGVASLDLDRDKVLQ